MDGGEGTAILDPESEIDMPRRKAVLLAQTTASELPLAEFVGRSSDRISRLRIVNATCRETDARYHTAHEPAATASTPDGLTEEVATRLARLGGQLPANARRERLRLQPSRVGAGEGGKA